MGKKVNPNLFRVRYNKSWKSVWFAKNSDVSKFVAEDYAIRKLIEKEFYKEEIGCILIEKTEDRIKVIIPSVKPGIIIGKSGILIEALKNKVENAIKRDVLVIIEVEEIKRPEFDPKVLCDNICKQLESREPLRKVGRYIKKLISISIASGAKGVKVKLSGRLDGVAIARNVQYIDGIVSLTSIREYVLYHYRAANTFYGCIGVKIWINIADQFADAMRNA